MSKWRGGLIALAAMLLATTLAADDTLREQQFTTLDGRTLVLGGEADTRPVYLKFWASWCGSCMQEMDHLQRTHEDFGDRVRVIAVNLGINDDAETVTRVREEYGLSMPLVIDDSGEIAQRFDLVATPYHVLLDRRLHVVHVGHSASNELDHALMLAAEGDLDQLPEVPVEPPGRASLELDLDSSQLGGLLFTATWCDWYLEDSRPAMAENCVAAQRTANELHQSLPAFELVGIVSRLWTGDDELEQYRQRYAIEHSLALDRSNDAFLDYEVRQLPSLVLIRDGREVARITDFSQDDRVIAEVRRHLD